MGIGQFTEFDKRVHKILVKKAGKNRLMEMYLTAIPKIRICALHASSKEVSEWTYAGVQLEKVTMRMKGVAGRTANVSYFFDPKVPMYGRQVGILHGLELRTLLQFLRHPLREIEQKFEAEGLTLPGFLRILHEEYDRLDPLV